MSADAVDGERSSVEVVAMVFFVLRLFCVSFFFPVGGERGRVDGGRER